MSEPPRRTGPYCGFGERINPTTKKLERFVVDSDCHIWILGRTGAGKTTMALVPMAIAHGDAPAVIVSSKDDLMQRVMEHRLGPSQLIDLRSVRNPMYPQDIELVRFDPTVSITSVDDALTAASTLLQMASTGYGSGAMQVTDGGTWESMAEGPLAAFLYAASPAALNMGMRWVLQAIQNPSVPEEEGSIDETPSWAQAARLVGEAGVPELEAEILHAMEMDPKQRDSVLISLSKATRAWLRMAVRKQPENAFDPMFLEQDGATLYVLAPGNGTTAAAAVTLCEQLIERWREKTSKWETLKRLMLMVDELPNTAPLPKLSNYVGEARGLNVNIVAACQASDQIDITHGQVYTNVLRKIFPAVLVMHGATERELLQDAAEQRGLVQRRNESQTVDGSRTQSGRLEQVVEWQELLPRQHDRARLLLRGGPGTEVFLPHCDEFTQKYWPQMLRKRNEKPSKLDRVG